MLVLVLVNNVSVSVSVSVGLSRSVSTCGVLWPWAKSWLVFPSYHSLLQPVSIRFHLPPLSPLPFLSNTLTQVQLCSGGTLHSLASGNLVSRMNINFQLVCGFTPYFAPHHHFLYISGLNFLCKIVFDWITFSDFGL